MLTNLWIGPRGTRFVTSMFSADMFFGIDRSPAWNTITFELTLAQDAERNRGRRGQKGERDHEISYIQAFLVFPLLLEHL